MQKLHIIQRNDGTVLFVAVMNPGMPADYCQRVQHDLERLKGKGDTVIVLPYASAVVVRNESLWQTLKGWWQSRRMKGVA